MKFFRLLDYYRLAKKNFFRAPQWELKLAIQILLGFLVLYFLAVFLFLGIGIYFLIKKTDPTANAILFLNQYMIYYFSADLLVRYFFQTLPVTDIKPLMTQPIQKKTIVRGVLWRSLLSVFNAFPLVILLPFCIVYSLQEGIDLSVWVWFIGILFLCIGSNFLIFLVNKSKKFTILFVGIFGICYALEKVIEFPILSFFGKGFDALYQESYWIFVPILFLVFIIRYASIYLKQQLYLDKGLGKEKGRMLGENLNVFDRWEEMGFFLKNDIRLILRNIRPRQMVLVGSLFLFYGVIFFTQEQYAEMPTILVFSGLFISGGFMLTFGQYVPAWDSEYFSFLMCQNLPYKKYLKSKLYLMMFSVVLSSILSLPYLFFGLNVMLIIWAASLFNFGFGGMITLFSGAYNTTPLKLNIKAKAFENTQNFSFTQMLFILPKLILPLVVFYVPYRFFGFNGGLTGLALTGVFGLFFQNRLLNLIVKIYRNKKHQTISAFNK